MLTTVVNKKLRCCGLSNESNYRVLNLELYSVEQELAAVELIDHSVIVLTAYWSAAGNFNRFIDQLNLCLNYLQKLKAKKFVLNGDFNVLLETVSREEAVSTNVLRSYGLFSTSRAPIRQTACLDTAATNIDTWECEVHANEPVIADHGAVVMKMEIDLVSIQNNSWTNKYTVEKRVVNLDNIPQLRTHTCSIDLVMCYSFIYL